MTLLLLIMVLILLGGGGYGYWGGNPGFGPTQGNSLVGLLLFVIVVIVLFRYV